jgi:hypothetical protein
MHEVQAGNGIGAQERLNAKGSRPAVNVRARPGFGPIAMTYPLGQRITRHQRKGNETNHPKDTHDRFSLCLSL